MNINFIDILVLIPVLWGGFKGFKNGLISEGGTFFALILGVWASVSFSPQGGAFVQNSFGISDQYKEIVAFSIIFLVVVIISFFITKLLTNFFKAISLEWLNKLLGIVFGAGKYLLIISFLFFVIQTLANKYYQKPVPAFESSLCFKPLSNMAGSVLEGNIVLPDFTFEYPVINTEEVIQNLQDQESE